METPITLPLLIPLAFVLLGAGLLLSIVCGKRSDSGALSAVLLIGCLSMFVGCLSSWPAGFTAGPLPIYLGGLVPMSQKADALSLFFLCILSFVAGTVALFSPSYLEHLKGHFHPGIYWSALFTFIASMAQVFLSADAITFTIFWELMSLSSVVLVVTDLTSHKARAAALIYLGATRVSTTLIFAGFLWMHALTKSWMFSDFNAVGAAGLIPMAIIFTGFCIKAGTWPFHLWLPYAHTEAPAPISALMSGVMVKVAIYGMIRLLLMSETNSIVLAYFALVLGTISAFWGILFAQVDRDLKRLLAYSTVENVGLIVLTFGLVLVSKAQAMSTVASLALAGCLLHVLNHAMYKPLLFLGAGAVDCGAHSRDLARLGGLHRHMPWTAAMFFFGSMAICALPPLNGFASKWLMYQGLFQFSISSSSIFDRAIGITIIGLLSMIGAMSVASFTKAFGLAFLGRPRTVSAGKAHEMPYPACTALGLLAAACVVLSIAAPLVVQRLAPIAASMLPSYKVSARLPESQLVIALILLLPTFYVILIDFGRRQVKRFATWECGYGEFPERSMIDPSSFSRSLGNLFGMVVQHRAVSQISGKDRRHFPDVINVQATRVFLVERFIWMPIIHGMEAAGRGLIRLQTGSIHIHLLYVFATLILLVVIGTLQ